VNATRLRLPLLPALVYSLAVVIAAGAVGLAAVGAAIQHYPGFTELWLTSEGKSTTRASLGVSNHEGSTKKYKLVLMDDKRRYTIYITLPNGQTWQEDVSTNAKYVTTADLYLLPDIKHPYRHVQAPFLCWALRPTRKKETSWGTGDWLFILHCSFGRRLVPVGIRRASAMAAGRIYADAAGTLRRQEAAGD